jgi:hypothetical protein
MWLPEKPLDLVGNAAVDRFGHVLVPNGIARSDIPSGPSQVGDS